MTIQDLFDRLRPISQEARKLLRDTGYHSDDGSLSYDVRPLKDMYEDGFFREKAEEILDQLEEICDTLSYLDKPCHGEYVLERLPNDRYGYFDDSMSLHTLTCGDPLEAKICDRYGKRRWVSTTVEHDSGGYFLRGFHSTDPDGLTIRERW